MSTVMQQNNAVMLEDEATARRRALLGRLRDDRKDLVRVAGVVRELAETLEVAQSSLAFLRRALHWLALVGGAATLGLFLRNPRRRPPALLLAGLSLYLVQRWLSHPVRHGLATATHPMVAVGPASAAASATSPPPRRANAAPPASGAQPGAG